MYHRHTELGVGEMGGNRGKLCPTHTRRVNIPYRVGVGGVCHGLCTCAGWYFRMHALVWGVQEEIVCIACPRPHGKSIFGRWERHSWPSAHVLLLPLGVPATPAPACRTFPRQ